jgi:hypothetical protein
VRSRAAISGLLIASAILAGSSSLAAAGDVSPSDWASRADGICRKVSDRNEPLIDRAFDLVDREKFNRASELWDRVWKRSLDGFDRISRLERPRGDARRIQRWLDGEDRSLRIAIDAGDELARGDVDRWWKLVKRAARIDRKAQRSVRDFDMPHCLTT